MQRPYVVEDGRLYSERGSIGRNGARGKAELVVDPKLDGQRVVRVSCAPANDGKLTLQALDDSGCPISGSIDTEGTDRVTGGILFLEACGLA